MGQDDESGKGVVPGIDEFSLRFEAFSSRFQFSQREKMVLLETLHGYNRTSIAEKLCISPETVKSYLSSIYLKAGVNSKQALVALVEEEPLPQNRTELQ